MMTFKKSGARGGLCWGLWGCLSCGAFGVALSSVAQTPEPLAPQPSSVVGLTSVASGLVPGFVPGDKPISLNFQNIDIKALLQVFADFSGLNVVPTDSVSGPVSVRLNDVPWQQALGIVLQSKGLVSRQEGRVLWVAPQGEWALREKSNWTPKLHWTL